VSFSGIIFVAAFLAGCSAALLRHPVYGLVTYIGVFYLHPPSRWWGQGLLLDVRWSLIAAGITLVAVLVNPAKQDTARVSKSGAFWGLVAFVVWIAVQSLWALDKEAHADLLSYYVKFLIVMFLFCRTIDSAEALSKILWAHVLGCFYLGWLAFTSYSGGRFEAFGGPGLGDANAAALQMVTATVVAGSLFLASDTRARLALLGLIPVILNAIVTTISRSGFLATAAGGLAYLVFAPAKYRRRVAGLSVLAVVLFAMLTNPIYWARIATLKHTGEEVEGVDTGSGRLVIIQAQWEMFKLHPVSGCGHMCTTVLSPAYLDASLLSAGSRASHNTFMSVLVDHGAVGALFYVMTALWIFFSLRKVASRIHGQPAFLSFALPAVAAALGAIWVGDLFAQYTKFEARIWFLSLVIVLLHLTSRPAAAQGPPIRPENEVARSRPAPTPASRRRARSGNRAPTPVQRRPEGDAGRRR
jgi:O-antigen ligase